MNYRVEIADSALQQVRVHAEYITLQAQAPLNAARWLARVFEAIHTLERFPKRYPVAPQYTLQHSEVRTFNCESFVFFYTIDEQVQTVRVLWARHGRQDDSRSRLPE